jgi:RNA polymerase sigma-70 factor (ECF subfamily)
MSSPMSDVARELSVSGPRRVGLPSADAVVHSPVPPEGDAALAARIRAGDADAFKAMFDLYGDVLHAYVMLLTHERDVADECVQDVMYSVWMLGPRWNLRDSIRGYLFNAARNHVRNHLRRGRVIGRWMTAASGGFERSGMSQGPEATDEACRRNEASAALRAALAHLPERRRLAVTLRCAYHLTNAQIAQAMGTSIKYVEREIMLGLRKMRGELAPFF